MTAVRTPGAVAVLLACTLAPATAHAVDFEVTGDVAAQGYEVASPYGDVVLGRRRLMSTLGLAVYNLQGDYEPFEADYSMVVRMRVDADFGVEGSDDVENRAQYVPGFSHVPVDMMYGYVQGRNLGGGYFDFRLGRQYTQNVFGWWNFDGGHFTVRTPFFIKASAYGGLEQRNGFPISTGRFATQGVWRGNHEGFRDRAQEYPSYQFTTYAPAFGATLESDGPNWIHGRLDYRRVWNVGRAFTNQFPAPPGDGFETVDGTRISSDRIGYALSAYLPEIGAVRGGFAYDLYNELISRAYGNLEFYVLPNMMTVGAEVDFFVPTFDGDSIWNWFTHSPVTTIQGRVAVANLDGFDASLSGGTRLWMADGDPETWAAQQCAANNPNPVAVQDCLAFGLDPSLGQNPGYGDEEFTRDEANRGTTIAPDLLGNVGARYRWGSGVVSGDFMVQTGFGGDASNRGHRLGGGLQARQALVPETLFLNGRASTYNWIDNTRLERHATSFGYMVAPEYQPWEEANFRVEWEHQTNRLVGQRFRIVGLIGVRVAP